MCEVEAIVNSRPLSVSQLTDSDSLSPLTPNHLLTMKTKVVLAPPGAFQPVDVYCRKRWRRVTHLATRNLATSGLAGEKNSSLVFNSGRSGHALGETWLLMTS